MCSPQSYNCVCRPPPGSAHWRLLAQEHTLLAAPPTRGGPPISKFGPLTAATFSHFQTPQVITREVHGKKQEPFEDAIVEVPDNYVGAVVELFAQRKVSRSPALLCCPAPACLPQSSFRSILIGILSPGLLLLNYVSRSPWDPLGSTLIRVLKLVGDGRLCAGCGVCAVWSSRAGG